ncbi:tyrosine-type recombinase/integrase [Saliphagus sp. GCM10025334]
MVVLLAKTGARGAELFNDLKDRERTGVTWGDVDLENAVLYVFGKGRKHNQEVPLPKSARETLSRWRRKANPPSDDWPIFPSWSYRARRKKLEDEIGLKVVSVRFEERGGVLQTEFLNQLLEEYEVLPPAISKERARQIMKQLTDEANIEVNDRHGYLTPHGARRRLGADLYAAGESERAQDALPAQLNRDHSRGLQPP